MTPVSTGRLEVDRASLIAHVPRLLLDWEGRAGARGWMELEGSLVYADITGFTPMSERLAVSGKAGAEELTSVVSGYFARLLALAYEDGAGLLKFAGDSLMLLLEGEDHARRACRAAWRMQAELRASGHLETSVGPVEVSMSMGVNSGALDAFVVGEAHHHLVLQGATVTRVLELETAARAGEVLVGEDTAAALEAGCAGRARAAGRTLLREPSNVAPPPPFPPAPSGGDPERCLPMALRGHLGYVASEGEHRQATVAFVGFKGTDAALRRLGPAEFHRRLDTLARVAEEAAAAEGVCLVGCDVEKDGGKLFFVAGAPDSSEWDEEKALRVCRQVLEAHVPLELHAGVNRGRVFTGEIGTPFRRTWAVMGDAVNVAARLMGQAPRGQLYTVPDVVDRARSQYETRRLEPLRLKGKARPVKALSVGRILGPRRLGGDSATPLVGREAEVAALRLALESAAARRGHLVELVAEAGLGKSRLVEELHAMASGVGVQAIACDPYRSSTPYSAFRDLLWSLLDLDPGLDAAANTETLTRRLARMAPDVVPWLPLLAIPLGIEVLPTLEAEELDPAYRADRLAATVTRLLQETLPEANLLTFEDVHWMDDASAHLLTHIAGVAGEMPWLICVTRRDDGKGFVPGPELAPTTIRLNALSTGSSNDLAARVAAGGSLHPERLAALVKKAGGNPLFLRELVLGARDGGSESLPDSVEAVIMSRIDRLEPSDRQVLRYASVQGPTFTDDVLSRCLPDTIPCDLDTWARLTEFVDPGAGGRRHFRHALFREVAYEGLSYERRRDLHERVGRIEEGRPGRDPRDVADLLSLHFSLAEAHAEAWRYSRLAGDRARAQYAHSDAAQFYARALASAAALQVDPAEVAGTWETLGDVAEVAGHYDQAVDAYRQARRLVRGAESDARLLQKSGELRERTGRYEDSIKYYNRGLIRAEKIADRRERIRRHMHLCLCRAGVEYRVGRFEGCIEWAGSAEMDAEILHDKEGLGHAYLLLHLAHTYLRTPDRAHYRGRAAPLLESVGEHRLLGSAYGNDGTAAYHDGDWAAALRFHQLAAEVRERAGDVLGGAISVVNTGEIMSDQGHYARARELIERALGVARGIGHRALRINCETYLGRLAAREGRFEEARTILQRALREATRAGAGHNVTEIQARLAELAVFEGDGASAETLAREALGSPGEGDVHGPTLHRLLGYALAQQGDPRAAAAELQRSLELARLNEAVYDEALAYEARARLARATGEDATPLEAAAEGLFRRLGIVATPPVPLPDAPRPRRATASRAIAEAV